PKGQHRSAGPTRRADRSVMPPMGGAQLSPSEVSAVVTYVCALSHRNGRWVRHVLRRPSSRNHGRGGVMKVGFIGLGHMGAGMAANLLRAGHNDIRLTLAAADDLRVPMPVASLLRDRFLTLLAQGGEALDWSGIGQLAARDAGQVDRLCGWRSPAFTMAP